MCCFLALKRFVLVELNLMNRRSKTTTRFPTLESTLIPSTNRFAEVNDVVAHTVSYLPAIDVLQCRGVSRRWRAAAEENDSYAELLEKVRRAVRHYNQAVGREWEPRLLLSTWLFCIGLSGVLLPEMFAAVFRFVAPTDVECDVYLHNCVGFAFVVVAFLSVGTVLLNSSWGRRARLLLSSMPIVHRTGVNRVWPLLLIVFITTFTLRGALEIPIRIDQLVSEAPEISAECTDGNSSKASFVYVRFSQPQLWDVGQPLQLPGDGEASFVVLSFVPPAQEQYEKICGPHARRSNRISIVDLTMPTGGDPNFWDYFSRSPSKLSSDANASPMHINGTTQRKSGFVVPAFSPCLRGRSDARKVERRLWRWQKSHLFKHTTLPILSTITGRFRDRPSASVSYWLHKLHGCIFGVLCAVASLVVGRNFLGRRQSMLQEPREHLCTSVLKRRLTRRVVSGLCLDGYHEDTVVVSTTCG